MIANRATVILCVVLALLTLPIYFVTNLLGGLVVSCTFGLILLPLSVIWMLFLGPLLALSWLWERVPWPARILIGVIGVPVASVAYVYVMMIPEPGEPASNRAKQILCQTFPLEMDLLRYRRLQEAERTGAFVGRATTEFREAMKTPLPRADDPAYASARATRDRLYAQSLSEYGLNPDRYTRITELLYSLGERD